MYVCLHVCVLYYSKISIDMTFEFQGLQSSVLLAFGITVKTGLQAFEIILDWPSSIAIFS